MTGQPNDRAGISLTDAEIRRIERDGLGDTDVHTAPHELVEVVESIIAARLASARVQWEKETRERLAAEIEAETNVDSGRWSGHWENGHQASGRHPQKGQRMSDTSAPNFRFYPCNRGGAQPAGLHRFEMNQFGACCIYCGKRGPAEPMTVTFSGEASA